jgi:hypothetical protein
LIGSLTKDGEDVDTVKVVLVGLPQTKFYLLEAYYTPDLISLSDCYYVRVGLLPMLIFYV